MRKFGFISLLLLLALAACNTSTLSFRYIESVPDEVEELIDLDMTVQLINEADKGSYIVFQSSDEVKADLDPQDNILNIKFNVTESEDDVVKPYVYYLTTDPEHDTIDVFVNGELTSFDEVTGL